MELTKKKQNAPKRFYRDKVRKSMRKFILLILIYVGALCFIIADGYLLYKTQKNHEHLLFYPSFLSPCWANRRGDPKSKRDYIGCISDYMGSNCENLRGSHRLLWT